MDVETWSRDVQAALGMACLVLVVVAVAVWALLRVQHVLG